MTTTLIPMYPQDAAITAAMRTAAQPHKGRFYGVDFRQPFDAMKAAIPPAAGVRTEAATIGGVPGWWCRPAQAQPNAVLLYLHGGAYVMGSAEAFRNKAGHFAAQTGVDVFVPDYRRAPEHAFPAAPDDVLAVCQALTAARIALVGDSAGGALALGLAARLAAAAHSDAIQPRAIAVMSPWTDLTLTGDSHTTRAEADPIFTREVLAGFAGLYLQGQDARDPIASPLYGQLKGLPPVRIDVGDDEVLLDDATRYADRARAAGVDVTLAVWEGMPHTFQSAVGKLRAADQSIAAMAAFLRRHLE